MDKAPLQKRSNLLLLVCTLLIPITNGGYVFSFSLYGNELKENLQLDQAQLATLSSAIFCAGALQWMPGLVIDRFGERESMITGAYLGSFFLLLYWAIAKTYIPVHHDLLVITLTFLTVSIYLSEILIYGSIFKIIVKFCHNSKGALVGVAKGQVGLGAGVFVVLFECLNRESSLDVLLFIAAAFLTFSAIIPTFFMPKDVMSRIDLPDPITRRHLNLIYMGMVSLAVLVVGESFLVLYESDDDINAQKTESDPLKREGPNYLRFTIVMSAWIGPIVGMLSLKPTPLHQRLPTVESTPSLRIKDDDDKEGKRSYSLVQMLRTVPAWLLVWSLVVLAGAGAAIVQNLGSMVESLELPEKTTSAGLAVFSVANAAARVIAGALSEYLLKNRDMPRPLVLLYSAAAAAVAHALMALSYHEFQFLVSVTLSGVAFGVYHPLLILIVGDLFGPKHMASNFLFVDGFTLAGGSLLMNKIITQTVYESHLEEGETTCIGRECFSATHWITCGLCMTSVLTCFCLLVTRLSRKAYSTTPNLIV